MSRRTVQNALLLYGIAEPQASPFITSGSTSPRFLGLDGFEFNELGVTQTQATDSLLPSSNSAASLDTNDPILNPIHDFPVSFTDVSLPQITSYTGPLSIITEGDLDAIILFTCSGIITAGLVLQCYMVFSMLLATTFPGPVSVNHSSKLTLSSGYLAYSHMLLSLLSSRPKFSVA